MLPLSIHTPASLARSLAGRVRDERKARRWSRAELAARSGVNVETLKRFETQGQISLERLLRIAAALGALPGFAALFPEPAAASLDELIARQERPKHVGSR